MQDYFRGRSVRQKAIMGAAFAATFLGILMFAWFAGRTPMALLYSGLDPAQSGAVIAAVEKSGAAYEVRGDSIWVPADRRDVLRMQLAGEGLPSAGGSGYELLDGMSGFGTTSQMFDAAYWRAKEGELARTILALPNVKTARVHLAVPGGRGQRREGQAAASVTLTTNGTPISQRQARALRYLLSSGVPGLQASMVTVIDSERGVVPSSDDVVAETREGEIKRNVERILEAHVGPGNAIVELHLDLVTEAEVLTEQRVDPQSRALISQESEESSDKNSNSAPGPVTAASNLPEGQNATDRQSQSARSETRQRSNFEVNRVTREVRRQPGDIRRLTVAVLVNGAASSADTAARSESELQAIRELVASAVGYDEARGDQITVKALAFVAPAADGTVADASMFGRLDLNSLAKIALIGVFALALILFLLRPILRDRSRQAAAPMLDTSVPPALPALGTAVPEPEMAFPEFPMATPEFDFVPVQDMSSDPIQRLKELMKTKQDETLKILTGWIAPQKEEAP